MRDVESGIYFDPERMHVLDHKGKYLSVRGPLNIARPVQGWPVIVQAGASEAGRQLAAETAEVVFAAGGNIEASRAFYADVKGRMARIGRDPDGMKILPGAFVVVGETVEAAKAKRAHLDSLVHYDSGIASLNGMLGYDVSGYDPDGPLPGDPADQRQPERPRSDRLGGAAREPDHPATGGARRQLRRDGVRRHAIDDRRRDAALAGDRRLRRLQHHVPLSARGARRLRRQGGPRTAGARPVPRANTRARPCARTSAWRGPTNRFFDAASRVAAE